MPRGDTGGDLGLFGWRRLRAAARAFEEHHQFITAGHLAFVGLFTLFPFLIVLVTIAAAIGSTDAAAQALNTALDQLPSEVERALKPVIFEILSAPQRGTLTLTVVTALWAASSGFEALRYAFNRAYGVFSTRQAWVRRVQSLVLTLTFAVAVLIATLGVVVVPIVSRLAAEFIELPEWRETARVYVGRGFGVAVLILATTAIYKVVPRPRLHWGEVVPGAVLAVIGWFALASAFGFYLTEFASLSVTYGSLGSVVAALIFFYCTACVVLFGCEYNAVARPGRLHRQP